MVKVFRSKKRLGAAPKPFKEWSPYRPVKDEIMKGASILDEVSGLATTVHHTSGSYWEAANTTGLCQSTISRLDKGGMNDMRLSTMMMLAAAEGYEVKLVPRTKKGR